MSSLAERIARAPPDDEHWERCRSATNPFRNSAYTLELGWFVTKALMSQLDWREVIEIQIAQELGIYRD